MKISNITLCAYGLADPKEDLFQKTWATKVKYLSEHVGIMKILDDDNSIKIAIIIDSETHQQDICQNAFWRQIKKEREELEMWQGRDLSDFFMYILHEWLDEEYARVVPSKNLIYPFKSIKEKPQYRDLFMDANFDLLVYLIRATKKNIVINEQDINSTKLGEHFFRSLLLAFKWSEDEITSLFDSAGTDIQEGNCPWDIGDGPLLFFKFIDRLEYMKKFYGNGTRAPQSKITMLKVFKHFVRWRDWLEAENLLKKTFPETYEKHKGRLEARKGEIILVPD